MLSMRDFLHWLRDSLPLFAPLTPPPPVFFPPRAGSFRHSLWCFYFYFFIKSNTKRLIVIILCVIILVLTCWELHIKSLNDKNCKRSLKFIWSIYVRISKITAYARYYVHITMSHALPFASPQNGAYLGWKVRARQLTGVRVAEAVVH